MNNKTLTTSADDLFDLVKSRGKVTIDEAAKELGLPTKSIHAIVDFLVEEKIFGIEYKFTTPYIYISNEKKVNSGSNVTDSLVSKEDFFKKAQERGVPADEIQDKWRKYIDEALPEIKKEFYNKCMERNVPQANIDTLWEKYLEYVR